MRRAITGSIAHTVLYGMNLPMRPSHTLGLAALLTLAANTCHAQTAYPVKLVRIVNPVAAGGNQDIVARAYAEQFNKAFGQQFVIENRPGNSAIIGTRYVKASAPDGYVLLAISNTFARTPTMIKDAGYDPLKDLAAVSMTSDTPLVFVVTPALPVKTVKEFIALAKQRPGEISSGSSGSGSTGHIAAEMFASRAGIKLVHIQYKGAAPALVDLVGGHVMLRFDQVSTSLPHVRAGKLRALGVTTLKRAALMPEVPTIAEAGLPGFQDSTFNGLMAPAGTPRAVLERLRAEVAKAAAVPELRTRYLDLGIELVSSNSSEDFSQFLRTHVEEFVRLAREAGLLAK